MDEKAFWLKEIAIQLRIANRFRAPTIKDYIYYENYCREEVGRLGMDASKFPDLPQYLRRVSDGEEK